MGMANAVNEKGAIRDALVECLNLKKTFFATEGTEFTEKKHRVCRNPDLSDG